MIYRLVGPTVAGMRYSLAAKYACGDILDIGCGKGGFREKLSSRARSYTGVDRRNTFPVGRFIQADVEKEQLEGQYDTVAMLAVLEHLNDPQFALRQIHSVLRPGGLLLLSTPTKLGDWIVRFIVNRRIGHVKIYNKGVLTSLLASEGFEILLYRTFEVGCNQFVVAKRRLNVDRSSRL